jgi:DNA-binding Lrp family transcriptional regulator
MQLTPLHKSLLNDFQQDFPLSLTPYQDIADSLGVTEAEVLTTLSELTNERFISRIGLIIPPNQLGVSCLVAMAIPAAQLETVAAIVSSYNEVNHNYERENHFNLWFVLIAHNAQHLQNVLAEIEQKSGFLTMQLPLVADYFINLGFELQLND